MSKYYVIPIDPDGGLPIEPLICSNKSAALESALRIAQCFAGLVIAEEYEPFEELHLIRTVGTVSADVLDNLVA